MRILVCVKHVPDLGSDRGFTPAALTVRTSADGTLNEVDENAIEAALQADEVIALSIGPTCGADALRRALQMGVHRAIHVSDPALEGMDAPATARALAAAIRTVTAQQPVDAVIMGMTALDGLGSVVPTMVAADLGWPVLAGAQELTLTPDDATIVRDLDGLTQELRAALPAVISVSDALNYPRLPKTKDILAARDKPIEAWTVADLGIEAPASRTTVHTAAPTPERADPELVYDDGTAGAQLASYLVRNNLLATAAGAPSSSVAGEES